MASRVDRTGTYRFDKVLEWGVGLTKKSEMPSFNVRLRLSEYYDEEENVWVDWSSAEVEQVCYFTLFGKNSKTGEIGPILNHEQIMKVFNWDGKSFQALANGDYSSIKGQIRIGDNDPEYADKNPFTVEWIDAFDADPARHLKSLDSKELKDLDAKFAMALQTSGKKAAPATAPGKTKKTGPTPPATKKKEEESEMTEEDKKAVLKAKSDKIKNAKKPGPPVPPPPVKEEEPVEESGGKQYTKQQAWEVVVEMKNEEVTDKQLNKAWLDAIEQVAGDADDKQIAKKQWGEIVDVVLDTEYVEGKTIGLF